MQPFIHANWHAWQGTASVLLSDESVGNLLSFPTVDDCINYLFLAGFKETARALNAHKRAA